MPSAVSEFVPNQQFMLVLLFGLCKMTIYVNGGLFKSNMKPSVLIGLPLGRVLTGFEAVHPMVLPAV